MSKKIIQWLRIGVLAVNFLGIVEPILADAPLSLDITIEADSAEPLMSCPKALSTSVVGQGQMQEVAPNASVTSYGFKTCHAVLIRNNQSGRLVFYHYWDAEDVNFSKLSDLVESFDPESTEVVLFGNKSSHSLDIMADYLSRRVKFIKRYKVADEGRWEVTYDQRMDQLMYRGTDSHHTVGVVDLFASTSADLAGRRVPMFDYRLRAREARAEIDRVQRKLSYVLNGVKIPDELYDLPLTEQSLRQLLFKKCEAYLLMDGLSPQEKADVERIKYWQNKILIRDFHVFN